MVHDINRHEKTMLTKNIISSMYPSPHNTRTITNQPNHVGLPPIRNQSLAAIGDMGTGLQVSYSFRTEKKVLLRYFVSKVFYFKFAMLMPNHLFVSKGKL